MGWAGGKNGHLMERAVCLSGLAWAPQTDQWRQGPGEKMKEGKIPVPSKWGVGKSSTKKIRVIGHCTYLHKTKCPLCERRAMGTFRNSLVLLNTPRPARAEPERWYLPSFDKKSDFFFTSRTLTVPGTTKCAQKRKKINSHHWEEDEVEHRERSVPEDRKWARIGSREDFSPEN